MGHLLDSRQLGLFPGSEQEPAVQGRSQDAADKTQSLRALADLARGCQACSLRAGCRNVVFGEGDACAGLVLVGEGPGQVEDELSRPFVGPSGQLLDRILAAADFRREDVFITNVVMCRPPGNRVPLPGEVAACRPWLDRKLAIIRPRIILCLGALAVQTLIETGLPVGRARGRWFERDESFILATYHPAAVLRDPGKRRPVWEDFCLARSRYLESTAR
ncbi:MAG TPA: uracil-DNA glycosylase [Bacillota bacterium]|nr:uracil-DNA glycosylase [Bacillota bacterium]